MSEQSDAAFEAWIDPRQIIWLSERTMKKAAWDAAWDAAWNAALAYQNLGEALDDLARAIQTAIEEWMNEHNE